jgi:hypothetical protein
MKYFVVYPVMTDIGGIDPQTMAAIFTGSGESVGFSPGLLSPDQFALVVKDSLAKGRFVTGGFGKTIVIGDDVSTTGHGWSVFLPTSPSSMVQIRNSWGYGTLASDGSPDRSKDGLLDIAATTDFTSMIDLRITEPGAAAPFAGATAPYAIPDPSRVSDLP